MDTKSLILAEINKNRQIKSSDITKITGFSRAYVNRLLNELENEGQIITVGKSRQTVYVLPNKEDVDRARKHITRFQKIYEANGLDEELVFQEINKTTGIFFDIKKNIFDILHYAFTEMLNNAIDHSQSKNIMVVYHRYPTLISFFIFDEGVGVFNNVQRKFNLPNTMGAIEHLIKGKQTTDPARHTGQGIFFTSKMADIFFLRSSDKYLRYIKLLQDYFIQDYKSGPGTDVGFTINLDSTTEAAKIFAQYSNSEFEFDKTQVTIKLYKNKDGLVSRSEAKRLLFGLEKFDRIILDFREVETVGQGFADEIWRVWQNQYPNKKIEYINANENVEAMIKMAINY